MSIFLPGAWLLHKTKYDSEKELIHTQNIHTLSLIELRLKSELHSLTRDILFLSELSTLNNWLANKAPSDYQQLSLAYLTYARNHPMYRQIRYLDSNGMERIRIQGDDKTPFIVPTGKLQDKSKRYYFEKGIELNKGEVYISPFDLNIENGVVEQPPHPTLRLATPVFDKDGNKRGIMVININGKYILETIQTYNNDIPGNLLLLNKNGIWVPPAKSSLNGTNNIVHSREDQIDVWQALIAQPTNERLETSDYTHFYIPINLSDTPGIYWNDHWFLLKQIPIDALAGAISSSQERQNLTIISGFFIITILSFFVAYLWTKKRILAEELHEFEKAEILRTKAVNQKLESRSKELEAINNELESFSYSVSHDLRAPIRAIDGFSRMLMTNYYDVIDERGRDRLVRIRQSVLKMEALISDLLELSRISSTKLKLEPIDLTAVAHEIIDELQDQNPTRTVQWKISSNMRCYGDKGLMRILLDNLLKNAWKFTSHKEHSEISISKATENDQTIFQIKDNGAGFNMKYSDRLFGAFQRFHDEAQFQGTGIGLATVQRIIHKHHGKIWVDAAENVGATFFFTLGGTVKSNVHQQTWEI